MSFTGSPDVGYALKDKASKKPVVLEVRFAVITPINHIFSVAVLTFLIWFVYSSLEAMRLA
jgi:hypothetical protein